MKYVSATDAKQSLAGILSTVQREPVVIRKQKKDVAVVLSMEEFKKITEVNIEEFQIFCDQVGSKAQKKGLTPALLKKILSDA